MRKPHAFTLIELLLVMVIFGVMAAVAVPSFLQSLQGNRLRSAARDVGAVGRYARSMAVLHQRDVVVTFDTENRTISVDLHQGAHSAPTNAASVDLPIAVDEEEEPVGDGPAIALTRQLHGVWIEQVQIEGGGLAAEPGQYRIRYATNGRCAPYEVTLIDREGSRMTIAVDALGTTELGRR